ncbi:MAG: hypothetical protein COX32_03205 [Candidatus Moranbacteria bacterium CG23_combo_of_CG06-09_8_20_14_all_41_28]|nr:MAG: hypothetical protein COX32_03205 [Candidatus Moranbacteria bacterium CG23_combo_of_CG06-09_8_20_14_all_41_28]
MEFLNPKKGTQGGSSTQQYVDVDKIRDGAIVMKNGSLRSILLVSSINFDLKSSEEQDAIIGQYQSFLNSLDFPLQIVVSSRRFNINPYVELLNGAEKEQESELLRFQISEYKLFIKNLTDISSIMSKYFYVVVPFSPAEDKEGGLQNKLFGIFRPKEASGGGTNQRFETYHSQLLQRVEHVIQALSGTGVRVAPLNTAEIIEILYNSYNPTLFTASVVKDINSVEISSF